MLTQNWDFLFGIVSTTEATGKLIVFSCECSVPWMLKEKENSSHIGENEGMLPTFFFLILYYLKYFTCVSFSPPLTSGHSQFFFKRGGFLDWGGVFSQAFPLPPLGGHCSPLLLSHWMWGKRWFLENAFCPFPSCLLDWAWRPGLVLNKGLDVRTNQTCLPLNNVISKERSQPWNKPGFK